MRLLSTLLFCVLVAACGKKDDTPPTPPPAVPPAAESDTSAPSAAADTAEPAPQADTAEPAPEADAATPTAAGAGDDWLVWTSDGDGYRTRWISVKGDAFEVVAEKKAVIVSDGAHIFRVERADSDVKVLPCECVDSDDACEAVGQLVRPGLRAVALAGGTSFDVYRASTEPLYGDDIGGSLTLAGGSDGLLFVYASEGGYFCGAHPMSDDGWRVIDLAKRDARGQLIQAVDKKLPAKLRDEARDVFYDDLVGCEGEMTKAEASAETGLDGFSVSLDERGKPTIEWRFSASVAYACVSDYAVYGTSGSPLLPEAAAVGLAPLPTGVLAALAATPSAKAVGWHRVKLEGASRDAALAAFRASSEPEWGPISFSERPLPDAVAATGDVAAAKKAVSEARKATRDKQYTVAIDGFTDAIAHDASYAPAYSGRGYAFLLAGSLASAEADFEKALTLDAHPKYQAQIYYNLGQIAEQQKDGEAAKAAYQKSIALRPNDAVKKALERVSAE